ncbi:MAG: hypothetical protein AAFX00_05155 [Pseudomonadota bacterium]
MRKLSGLVLLVIFLAIGGTFASQRIWGDAEELPKDASAIANLLEANILSNASFEVSAIGCEVSITYRYDSVHQCRHPQLAKSVKFVLDLGLMDATSQFETEGGAILIVGSRRLLRAERRARQDDQRQEAQTERDPSSTHSSGNETTGTSGPVERESQQCNGSVYSASQPEKTVSIQLRSTLSNSQLRDLHRHFRSCGKINQSRYR